MTQQKEFLYLIIARLRFPIILLITVYTISILGLVLIPTYDNNGEVYYLSFFEAFFVIIYTSTTVGFGETPYPWTDYQKFWMALCTIATVTSWLISIGRIISIMQDPVIKLEKKTYFFKRQTRNLKSPFYVVAGFGKTGQLLSKNLIDHGMNVVIIEKDKMLIESVKYLDYKLNIPYMYGDISNLELLKMSGILNPYCQGLILTTSDEEANLKAALNTRILNQNIKIISRAQHFDVKSNLKSFNTDLVVSPYSLFGKYIKNKLTQNKYINIKDKLTKEILVNENPSENIPKTHWIIFGFNKFGKTLYRNIKNDIKDINILYETDNKLNILSNHNHFNLEGVSKEDLIQSNIENSNVIVLTDKDDHKNLSAIYTARTLNHDIFIISVLNKEENYVLFKKLNVNFIIQPNHLLVREIFPMISEPLLFNLLKKLEKNYTEDNLDYLYRLLKKIEKPFVWSIQINEEKSPSITKYLDKIEDSETLLTIQDVISGNYEYNKFPVPLIIYKNDDFISLPEYSTEVNYDDIILFVGSIEDKNKLEWVINDDVFFERNIEFSNNFSMVDYIKKI